MIKQVVYINDHRFDSYLEVGKVYDVLYETPNVYYINKIGGGQKSCCKHSFLTLQEWRDYQIRKILNVDKYTPLWIP